VVDTLGLMLVVMVTSASVQDRRGGRAILELLAARFPGVALVWADGGYANKIDSGILAWAKEKLGLLVEIVKRNDDVKGLRGPATPVGGRADFRLVGPQPPAGPGL
jgi:Transposase DDE domain